MIELKKVVNLKETISAYLSDRRAQQKLPPTSTGTQGARIINQEKDGCVLYTWDDVAKSGEGAIVTHFGLYDPFLQKHELIHIYSQRVYVASCSINQERTLMAFTVMSKDSGSAVAPEKRSGKETFSAYLAELKTQNIRVFSLNLERQTFLKVQFLYGEQVSEKESYMLVMLHRESIGLYRIPLGRVNKGMVMRGQPRTEQVTKKFIWCQWDPHTQQLFYLHFRRDGDGNKQPILSSVQFYQNAQYDHLLDVPLNFPIPNKTSARVNYIDMPLHFGIPDTTFNISVMTQSNGTFCICYQQPCSVEKHSKSSPLPRTSPLQRASPLQRSYQPSPTGSDGDCTELNYYICMVHHGKTLHGCVSGVPASVIRRATVHFSWQGDSLMVMLPGYFVHLLNLAIEFEPCHHILLHSKTYREYYPSGAVTKADESLKITLPVLSLEAEHLTNLSNTSPHGLHRDIATGGCVYDTYSGHVYKVTVNTDILLQTFTQCYMPTTRTALLHYAILRIRDLSLIKKMFEVLYNDITSAEVPGLMTEYLTSMTYSSMRRQMDREVLRLLPFTSIDSFRGQFDKTLDGDRLARVSYTSIHSVNIGTKTAKERQQKRGNINDDLWDILRRHLRWMQYEKASRFSQEIIQIACQNLQADLEKRKGTEDPDETSFLTMARIHTSLTRQDSGATLHRQNSKPDMVLGTTPPFLQTSTVTESSEQLASMTKELVSKHLQKYLTRDSKVKAQNVAKEYVSCQMQQSRQLCHLLWSIRGPVLSQGSVNILPELTEPSSVEEYELFQMLERYSLALTELLYPIPQGFPSYFTAVAFRCLDFRLFMQYVSAGALQLTGNFMAQVLADLPDTDHYCKVKHYIISQLPQSSAEECYRQWGHPTCNTYFAYQQVTDILTGQSRKPSELSASAGKKRNTSPKWDNTIPDMVSFQPLAAFLKHLQRTESETGYLRRDSPLDTVALEEVALFHTRSETNYNMGTVNF